MATTVRTRRPRFAHPLVAVVLLVGAGVLVAGWWWGRGLQSWWTARELVEALRRGDCAAASRYFPDPPSPSACPPSAYGLPDDLTGYSLQWDRVGHAKDDDQTAVALLVPGDQTVYSLHMVHHGLRWIVDEVDVSA